MNAVSAGASVEATLSDATGPQIHVTGTSGMLSPVTEVLASRLMPVGWKSAVEKNGLCPCANAVAGHWKNHRNRAGSPQPQRVCVVAPWDHAWAHNTNPTATIQHTRRQRGSSTAATATAAIGPLRA